MRDHDGAGTEYDGKDQQGEGTSCVYDGNSSMQDHTMKDADEEVGIEEWCIPEIELRNECDGRRDDGIVQATQRHEVATSPRRRRCDT